MCIVGCWKCTTNPEFSWTCRRCYEHPSVTNRNWEHICLWGTLFSLACYNFVHACACVLAWWVGVSLFVCICVRKGFALCVSDFFASLSDFNWWICVYLNKELLVCPLQDMAINSSLCWLLMMLWQMIHAVGYHYFMDGSTAAIPICRRSTKDDVFSNWPAHGLNLRHHYVRTFISQQS